jgi:hypothetical protein
MQRRMTRSVGGVVLEGGGSLTGLVEVRWHCVDVLGNYCAV